LKEGGESEDMMYLLKGYDKSNSNKFNKNELILLKVLESKKDSLKMLILKKIYLVIVDVFCISSLYRSFLETSLE
jgi:hypothetical protein